MRVNSRVHSFRGSGFTSCLSMTAFSKIKVIILKFQPSIIVIASALFHSCYLLLFLSFWYFQVLKTHLIVMSARLYELVWLCVFWTTCTGCTNVFRHESAPFKTSVWASCCLCSFKFIFYHVSLHVSLFNWNYSVGKSFELAFKM